MEELPPQRSGDGRFLPGASGNPGGRPGMPPALKEAFRANSLKALGVLVAGLDDPDPKIRIACAQHILDRSYGKPVQETAIEVTGGGSPHLQALISLATGSLRRSKDDGTEN